MNRLETSLPIDVMIATAVVTLIVFCCKMSMSKVIQVCPMSDNGIGQRAIQWLKNTSSNFDEAQKSGKYQIWTFWIATSFILNSLSSSAFCNEHLSPPRLTPLPKISWLKQNLLSVIRVHLHNNLGLAYFPTAFPFCGKYFSSTSLEWKVFEPLLNEQPVLLEV